LVIDKLAAMNEVILEKQYFRQWWIIILFGGIDAIILYGLLTQLITGTPWGDKPLSDIGVIILYICFTLFALFFMNMGLQTRIDDHGIHFKFIPFSRRFTTYLWSEISKCEVREYSPVKEYGGWGIRYGRNGMAYNVSGNQGIDIILKNGKRVLIGTKKNIEIQLFLSKIESINKPI
jgi:hypothetical protein